jgi:hypothetical protein
VTEVPLSSEPSQIVTITLGDVEYDLAVKWGDVAACWTLDITRVSDQETLAAGVRLVLGVDLLQSYGLGIGALHLVDLSRRGEEATSDDGDLGTRCKLYFTPPGEL